MPASLNNNSNLQFSRKLTKKRVFASAVASSNKVKIVKPGETTVILFPFFWHKRLQDYCLLSLKLCSFCIFPKLKLSDLHITLIVTKNFVPPFFLFLAGPVEIPAIGLVANNNYLKCKHATVCYQSACILNFTSILYHFLPTLCCFIFYFNSRIS